MKHRCVFYLIGVMVGMVFALVGVNMVSGTLVGVVSFAVGMIAELMEHDD